LEAQEEDLAFTYQAHRVDTAADWFVTPRFTLGVWGSGNTERRERLRTGSTAAEAILRQRLAWSWWEGYGAWSFLGGDALTLAVNEAELANRVRAAAAADRFRHRLRTSQFYALWELAQGNWFRWMFTAQAGRVVLAQTPSDHASRQSGGTTLQVKGGAGFALVQAQDYRLWFHTTWDGDAFSQRQWDGGNLQLLLYF
jgi:hypothetical protein